MASDLNGLVSQLLTQQIDGLASATGMDAAVGSWVVGEDVVIAQVLLDLLAALGLFGAGVAGPVDEKPLSTDGTADIAGFVGKRTKNLVHGPSPEGTDPHRMRAIFQRYCRGTAQTIPRLGQPEGR